MNHSLYVTTQCCKAEQINKLVLALPTDASGGVSGLIMTPTTCELCAWRGGQFEGDKETIKQAFEVRAFCDDWELRWIREGTNGVATLLSEKQISAGGWFARLTSNIRSWVFKGERPLYVRDWPEPSKTELEDTLNRRYLLWGERKGDSQGSGWTKLTNGRTGPIDVPVGNCTSRIQLKVREYLARFEDGNVCVFDQRLIGLADAEE